MCDRESIHEIMSYIFDFEHRIAALENELRALKSGAGGAKA